MDAKYICFYLFFFVLVLSACSEIGPSTGPVHHYGVQYKFDGEHWEEVHGKEIDIRSMPDNPILEFKTTGLVSIANDDSNNLVCLILDPLVIEDYEVKNTPVEVKYYEGLNNVKFYSQLVQFRKSGLIKASKVKLRLKVYNWYWGTDYADVTLIIK